MTIPPFSLHTYKSQSCIDSALSLKSAKRDEFTALANSIIQASPSTFEQKYFTKINEALNRFETHREKSPQSTDFTQLTVELDQINKDFGLNILDEQASKIKTAISKITTHLTSNKETLKDKELETLNPKEAIQSSLMHTLKTVKEETQGENLNKLSMLVKSYFNLYADLETEVEKNTQICELLSKSSELHKSILEECEKANNEDSDDSESCKNRLKKMSQTLKSLRVKTREKQTKIHNSVNEKYAAMKASFEKRLNPLMGSLTKTLFTYACKIAFFQLREIDKNEDLNTYKDRMSRILKPYSNHPLSLSCLEDALYRRNLVAPMTWELRSKSSDQKEQSLMISKIAFQGLLPTEEKSG